MGMVTRDAACVLDLTAQVAHRVPLLSHQMVALMVPQLATAQKAQRHDHRTDRAY